MKRNSFFLRKTRASAHSSSKVTAQLNQTRAFHGWTWLHFSLHSNISSTSSYMHPLRQFHIYTHVCECVYALSAAISMQQNVFENEFHSMFLFENEFIFRCSFFHNHIHIPITCVCVYGIDPYRLRCVTHSFYRAVALEV